MVAGNKRSAVPLDVFRRFPGYLRVLEPLREAGRPVVSEAHLARELGIDAAQVQSDLSYVGQTLLPRSGLIVDALVESIRTVFGWENYSRAVLVGAGRLGRSLLTHPIFRQLGATMVAAFDDDTSRVGHVIGGVPVLSMDKLETLVVRLRVHLGILAVPAPAAQETADRLVTAGIRALWNFAPCPLTLPPDVIVKTEDMSAALASLSPFGSPPSA